MRAAALRNLDLLGYRIWGDPVGREELVKPMLGPVSGEFVQDVGHPIVWIYVSELGRGEAGEEYGSSLGPFVGTTK